MLTLISALLTASNEAQNIIETTTNAENIWAVENSFLIILSLILIAILIAFANRVNKLEDAVKNINERFDKLSGTLIEISKRPCQISSLGYCVCFKKNKSESVIDNTKENLKDTSEETE